MSATLERSAAPAQVWDNGAPDGHGASGGPLASQFALLCETALSRFNWYLLADRRCPSIIADFTVQIWSDSNGVPGQALWRETLRGACGFNTGLTCGALGTFAFGADLGEVELAAGRYWIGVDEVVVQSASHFWATTSSGNGTVLHTGDTWSRVSFSIAWNLEGSS